MVFSRSLPDIEERPPAFAPPPIRSSEDTGLTPAFIGELVLKRIYYGGTLTGHEIARQVRLPFPNVVDVALDSLRRSNLLEVKSGMSPSPASYEYALTSRGHQKVLELLERNGYAGPAPVPLEVYRQAVAAQSIRGVVVTRSQLARAFAGLVISPTLLDQLGPAVNSGRSLFLFGPPGNGKTSIAETVTRVLGGAIYLPFAVEYDGQVIKLFDPVHHRAEDLLDGKPDATDRRWVLTQRPVVVAGGELTMAQLDLVYSETSHFYEAPLQMKANGGMFLIDDFGRQQVSPRDLLNRWIVPLEKREDYLSLRTGQVISVPFDQLIIFSTNLEPHRLVDEAFLRRIRYKVQVPNPTEDEFREIFARVCAERGVPYEPAAVAQVIAYVQQHGLELRCCQPRDLVEQIIDIATFTDAAPRLTPELVRLACASYFVRV